MKSPDNNVAREFNIGKTRVKICTDYCVESPDEIKSILNNIAKDSLSNINPSVLKEDI